MQGIFRGHCTKPAASPTMSFCCRSPGDSCGTCRGLSTARTTLDLQVSEPAVQQVPVLHYCSYMSLLIRT